MISPCFFRVVFFQQQVLLMLTKSLENWEGPDHNEY